jgi:hypothetical protein
MAANHDLRSRREVLLLGMLGLALLSSGGPASSEDEAAQAADRDARQRAYGTKTGNPGKAKPKS